MKAIIVDQPRRLRVANVPKPRITRLDDVLVRVCYGSICGSDVGIYTGANKIVTYPRIIGHEFGGIVEAVGPGAGALKPGDAVAVDPVISCGRCYACRSGRPNVCAGVEVRGVHRDGGFAEYAAVPEAAVHRVDSSRVPLEALPLVEPYSIGVEVAHRGRVAPGDRVLVLGAGPIGIAVTQVAKLRGATVLIADRLDARLERAKRLGADLAVNVAREDLHASVMDLTGGEGMPVVVDCACTPDTFRQAIQLAGFAGRVVTLGLVAAPSPIASMEFVKKGLDVMGSRLNNGRFDEVIALFESGDIDPRGIISGVYPCEEAEAALLRIIEHPEGECKVVLKFD